MSFNGHIETVFTLGWRKPNQTDPSAQPGSGDFQRGCQWGCHSSRHQRWGYLLYGPAQHHTTEIPWHRNRYRLRRSEKSFCKEAEVMGGASGRKHAGRCLPEFHSKVTERDNKGAGVESSLPSNRRIDLVTREMLRTEWLKVSYWGWPTQVASSGTPRRQHWCKMKTKLPQLS